MLGWGDNYKLDRNDPRFPWNITNDLLSYDKCEAQNAVRAWGWAVVRSWAGNHWLRSGLKPGSSWTNGNIIVRNFVRETQMDSSQNVVLLSL